MEQWAQEISETLIKTEDRVLHKQGLIDGFKEAKVKVTLRNGSAILEQMTHRMEDILIRRVRAAENIMRHAEALSSVENIHPPSDYTYDYSFVSTFDIIVRKDRLLDVIYRVHNDLIIEVATVKNSGTKY